MIVKKKFFAVMCAALLLVLPLMQPTVFGAPQTVTDAKGIVYTVRSDGSTLDLSDGSAASGSLSVPAALLVGAKAYRVAGVGRGAFGYACVTQVSLPKSVTEIGDDAFIGCIQLEEVSLGGAETSVGNHAFSGCTALTAVNGAENVTYVGADAFAGTPWLSENRGSAPLYLGKCLVSGGADAGDFTVPAGILSVAPHAFEKNTSLSALKLNDVKKIGANAFAGCENLASVSFGNPEEIGDGAFAGCIRLNGTLNLPASLLSLGAEAFRGCALDAVALEETQLSSLPNGAFADCAALKSVSLPDGTVYLGAYAFENCEKLADVAAPGVRTVGYDAFRNCRMLAEKDGFSAVESVGTGAFDGTPIYEQAEGLPLRVGNALYKTEETVLSTPAIEDGIAAISPLAFYNLDAAPLLALPASLEEIGRRALPGGALRGASVYSFSKNAGVYDDLSLFADGTLYVPAEVSVPSDDAEASNVSVGTITGISVTAFPKRMDYAPDDPFDPDGIVIVLDTEKDGAAAQTPIAEIGYTPAYGYDFSTSGTVTVTYCGYETAFSVRLAGEKVLPGDLDGNGSVGTDDVLMMVRYLGGLIQEDAFKKDAADLDGNGNVDTDDLLRLIRIVAGIDR